MKPTSSLAYSPHSRPLCCAALLCLVLLLPSRGLAEVYAFFEGTQYPLEVHVLEGREPGPTVMVQGGIQGDEVSGFLSAQTLTRAKVRRGTLIVIPRANVPSISHRSRVVNVDLNRRFDREYDEFYEDRLARVIRHFLARSQAFIHLHEGSGFYSPTYVNGLRNPKRWGQSVIIDAGVYENSLDLSGMVRSVLSRLNPQVRPADYRFELFNTDTFSSRSPHSIEMRKSLTCYALKAHRIPALAIEVSKNITPLDWKVREQLRATVLFLEKFGVSVQLPDLAGVSFERFAAKPPTLRVNGQPFRPGGTIELHAGQPLRVEIDQNSGDKRFSPSPALYADGRLCLDLAKSPRFLLDPIKKLELRADGRSIGTADVRFLGSLPAPGAGDAPLFVLWHNGRLKRLAAGQMLHAVEGDQFLVEGVSGSRDEVVNIKGIITRPGENTGQDAGIEVVLDFDSFMQRFLVKDAEGRQHIQVSRETPGRRGAEFLIALEPRRVESVTLMGPQNQNVTLPLGGPHRLQPGEWRIESIRSNGDHDRLLPLLEGMPLRVGQRFVLDQGEHLQLEFRQATTFKPVGGLTLVPAALAENTRTP